MHFLLCRECLCSEGAPRRWKRHSERRKTKKHNEQRGSCTDFIWLPVILDYFHVKWLHRFTFGSGGKMVSPPVLHFESSVLCWFKPNLLVCKAFFYFCIAFARSCHSNFANIKAITRTKKIKITQKRSIFYKTQITIIKSTL